MSELRCTCIFENDVRCVETASVNCRRHGELPPAQLRVFHLWREADPSGVSGTGWVAIGTVFPSGKVILEWLLSEKSMGIYESLESMLKVHGHGGLTYPVWRPMRKLPRPPVRVEVLPIDSSVYQRPELGPD